MSLEESLISSVTRRRLLGSAGAGMAMVAGFAPSRSLANALFLPAGQTPESLVDELVIDLS